MLAVKEAAVPEHRLVLAVPMVMPGVTLVITTMAMALEVAVGFNTHAALLLRMQVMTSPLAKPPVLNTLLLVPTFTPFFLHW
jgi:hypothetical protein